jgi:GMP synthase (glutamine-hydrolysing)
MTHGVINIDKCLSCPENTRPLFTPHLPLSGNLTCESAEGKTNSKVAHFGHVLEVGHWHSDMPGLTAQARILAGSEGCPRQIVEYSKLVYGFQCHMEFTREVVELLIAASETELANLTRHRFVQQPAALRANDWDEMNQKLFTFLDKLVAEYQLASLR